MHLHQGFFGFGEGWGLHPDKLGICGNHLRSILVSSHWWSLVHLLRDLLLRLQNLAQHFSLSGHESPHWHHGWRRW
jgi:hypothetical protein